MTIQIITELIDFLFCVCTEEAVGGTRTHDLSISKIVATALNIKSLIIAKTEKSHLSSPGLDYSFNTSV